MMNQKVLKILNALELVALVLASAGAVGLVVLVGSVVAGLDMMVPKAMFFTVSTALAALVVMAIGVAINFFSGDGQ